MLQACALKIHHITDLPPKIPASNLYKQVTSLSTVWVPWRNCKPVSCKGSSAAKLSPLPQNTVPSHLSPQRVQQLDYPQRGNHHRFIVRAVRWNPMCHPSLRTELAATERQPNYRGHFLSNTLFWDPTRLTTWPHLSGYTAQLSSELMLQTFLDSLEHYCLYRNK